MAQRTWHPCPSDRASGTGSVGIILLHSSASVWGARASCCVAWATLDLPPSSLTETLSSSLSLQNFAKEFVISDRKELEEDFIRSELKKAGGANYDAQTE